MNSCFFDQNFMSKDVLTSIEIFEKLSCVFELCQIGRSVMIVFLKVKTYFEEVCHLSYVRSAWLIKVVLTAVLQLAGTRSI